MGKYTRISSNYILRKKHKMLSNAQILERDWTTIGGLDRFAPGKRPYYRDGNFVFTTNSVPSSQKKHIYGNWVGEWTYDDVKDVTSTVNELDVNYSSDDMRDFAYYGSCVEMVRASVENIISYFPSQISVTSFEISVPPSDEGIEYEMPSGTVNTTGSEDFEYIEGYYQLYNPFSIDLYHSEVQYGENANMMRYMSYSYEYYTILTEDVGDYEEITSYSIYWTGQEGNNGRPLSYDEYYCNYQYKIVVTITINGTIKIYGYQIEDEIVFVTDNTNLVIKPSDEIIEEYFNNLKGFERQLLTRKTTPLYKNNFITPIEYSRGVKYVYRTYTWPSNGYQILIDSGSYTSFINSLLKTATYFDDTWCDNIYRSMTHEAIKNYDWTYTREYSEGDEEDNVDGGDRMANILRLVGAFFDDIKRYIDGIKLSSSISYDGFNNQPDSLMPSKLELNGIEPYSVIPVIDDVVMSDVKLTQDFLDSDYVTAYSGSTNSSSVSSNWYTAFGIDEISTANMENEFMRRMLISAKYIMRTKGTAHSIDMIFGMFGFGENDYTLTEEYRSVVPKLYGMNYDYFTELDVVYWISNLSVESGSYVFYNGTLYLCKTSNSVSSFNSNYYTVLTVYDWENDTAYSKDDYVYYNSKYYICTTAHTSSGIGYVYYNINQNKDLTRYYDDEDEYSGIPLKNILINGDIYVVPYIDADKDYDGYIYFQSKGGWGLNSEDAYGIEYMETQSYLGVVSTVAGLFEINPNKLKDNDIYYVIDISDLLDYDESASLSDMSHMFYVVDRYSTQSYTGWCNVNAISDESISSFIQKKAEYLESIISVNINNNPHIGFGNYDTGETYFDYMKQPFKYAIDNNYLPSSYVVEAEDNEYDVTTYNDDKIVIIYDDETIKDKYYLNSKVFTITNNIDNDLYRQYFKDVILNYIIQVLPSTAILVLKNFSIES